MSKSKPKDPSSISMNRAETSAVAIMRDLKPSDREDAFKWFKSIAKDKAIRDQILDILKEYASKKT